ncbi:MULTISPECIES: M1 family metallopeptidase [Niastella]|uniref:M1 family metallopeptidase n=1 Tax=Niastella soli TaxID=2821487 RepID=A0ABS3YXE1_9BACT|nr:M1 family metallopeptidase [Niastella soli]MBO9202090.1 M1 family metallopeptidase [Niastella soli]
MTRSLFILASLFLVMQAGAQTLTMPAGIQKAYENGTRSTDGKPGKNYWQNHGRYTISLTVLPPDSIIRGMEQIVYFNNSPDTLKSLNMKLIMNFRQGSAITVDEIMVQGSKVAWDNTKANPTNQKLDLSAPLLPHDSVNLNITWHYKLLRRPARDGIIDSTSFYLAYFYPRVAVYDDYKGWDTQPHYGSLEFYNDFNDYTVNVTVPANFMVWATGTLQNPSEVLQPAIAERLQQSMTSDSTIHVATVQDWSNKQVTAQNASNTWKWVANNISDIAIGISDHYDWDAASVIVDNKTKRRVSMQAAFADSSIDFHHSVQFGRYSLAWFSKNWPGVPYPYPKSNAFQGFADMEYPMMINDSHTPDLVFAQLVQDHEQAHTYFPFYMGTNESYYAFMDEGWATTFEYLIGIDEKGQQAADKFYKTFRVDRWIRGPHEKENPIITPSPDVTFGGGNNAYGKPSLSYLALKDLLGNKLFKKALHNYMNNWNGKHPIPWDYFYSMGSGAKKNLDWFFYNWFYTPNYIDLNLTKVEQTKKGYALNIKNIGGFAVPFDVIATYDDGSNESFHQTPIVWEANQKETVVPIKTRKKVKSLKLEGGIFMDATEKDNTWTAGS